MAEAGQRQTSLAVTDPDAADGFEARIQALFKQAHRRRQRRRLAYALISAVSVIAVVLGLTAGWPSNRSPLARHGNARPARTGAPRFTLPAAMVAWVDYNGQVHLGDVATLTQRVVATVPALAGISSLAQVGGRLYAGGSSVIRQVDLATGAVRRVAPGTSVFTSADGRHLYVVQSDTSLLEVPAVGNGAARRLTVPSGWYVDPPDQAVAGGVVVVSRPGGPAARSWKLAVWNPGRGGVRIVGRGAGAEVMGAYTPPGARYSLLAWQPAGCPSGDCPIEITNTATMATVTVRSPLHHGFTTLRAAFSPDGSRLAVFARTASLDSLRANGSELGLADTRTGAVRLVGGASLDTPEDAGWVLWLPGGTRLLAGALNYSYAVDAATYAARPFFFFPGNPDHDIMDTPDVNFSVTLTGSG
ncbi:MAG: hypothetical protein ACRDOU_09490 [Streptosporangiaceae bacterium]